MRDMIIIFLVLLAILIMVSAFGGCIRFKETYNDSSPMQVDESHAAMLSETLKPWETNPVFSTAVEEEHEAIMKEPPRVLFDQSESVGEETQEITGIPSTPMSIGGGLEFAEID